VSRSIEVEDSIITERNARFFVHLFAALEAT
jgi:hypothetical protein